MKKDKKKNLRQRCAGTSVVIGQNSNVLPSLDYVLGIELFRMVSAGNEGVRLDYIDCVADREATSKIQ